MRKLLSFALLLTWVIGLAQENDYCLNIGEFSEFTVADGINVVYKSSTDSAGYATFKATKQIVSGITFSNSKNKLKIQLNHDMTFDKVPTVTIYSLALAKANNWGDSTITIERINPGAEFKANVTGNGDIIAHDVHCTKVSASVKMGNGHIFLAGKAQSAKYELISAGCIEAASLEAAQVKAQMMGTGNIDCWATESLTVVGASSGHVYYKGDPSTVKNRSIGVKIDKVEE